MSNETQLLINAVTEMRTLQNQYWEARRKNMTMTASNLLPLAKAAEKKVDKMILSMNEQTASSAQPKLF